MKSPKIYDLTGSAKGILESISHDKIKMGMGLIAILALIGSILDSGYSMKLGDDSIDLHP